MTDFPAANYVSNALRTEAEMKTAFEAWLAATKQLPGGAPATTLTIVSDQITPTVGFHLVDTEGAAATDNVAQILQTNLPDGSLLLLRMANAGRLVVLKHNAGGTGQLSLANGVDLTLVSVTQHIVLRRNGTQWDEVPIAGSGGDIGDVKATARSSPPTGWLVCDGSSLLRAGQYAGLFAAIGTTYGAVDGTHFSIPDLRGRTIAGAGQGVGLSNRVLAQTMGTETHVLSIGEMPSHNHSHQHFIDVEHNGGAGSAVKVAATDGTGVAAQLVDVPQANPSTGGGTAHNNMQPTAILNWIIRAF